MALSDSVQTNSFQGRYYKLTWTATQSIENNTSTISWEITCAGGQASWYAERTLQAVIDGKTVFNKTARVERYAGKVAAGTTTLTHDSAGAKSFSVSLRVAVYLETVNCTGSGSFTLDTISRASQPSLVTWPESTQNVGNFGEEFSIHMNRASDAFTHTVRYEYGNRKDTIATGVTTGTTWTVPLDFMNDIPKATSASGRIYVDTYKGSTLIGTKYTGFTVTVPVSVKPSCTFILDDITAVGEQYVDDLYGSPVKGLSKIKVAVAATEAYSSPITAYSISANGSSYAINADSDNPTETEITTEVLKTAGTSRVTVTVTDARGRKGTRYYDMTVLDYNAPTISKLTVARCDADGTENEKGEYCRAVFSAAVSGMSNKNTATYTLRYKKTSATSWSSVTITDLANKYTVTDHMQVFAADGNDSYDVEITVADRHNSETRSTSVSTAFTLFNCHASGTGWRFGGVAEKENTLQNDLELCQTGNTYAFQPNAFNGEKGYTLIATITLTALNVNAPIVFTINRRAALCPMTVYVRFKSASDSLDPDLDTITYDGDNFGAFMVKTEVSTWRLYVDNTSGWSNPCLQSWYTTDNQMARLNVTFSHEQIEGTAPSVLGTYYRATPAKMQSILDYVYPVGSVYISYSHVSPADLFGGTWVRMENAFLWATDANGVIGQTGGAKTHTLTVNEMPSHTHKPTTSKSPDSSYPDYTFQVMTALESEHTIRAKVNSGSQYIVNAAEVSLGGGNNDITAVTATAPTGGGAAHNNMPPYIQVSIWRRTA